jgi:PcfJ-like protein
MDAKPKSNKIKRLERRRKREERADRRSRARANSAAAARTASADYALKGSDSPWRGSKQLLQRIIDGEVVQVSTHSDLFPIWQIFDGVRSCKIGNGYPQQPDARALKRLVVICHAQTNLFRGRERHHFAGALLAISAHSGRWLRSPEDWKVRSHNRYRQFYSLVRHLLACYDVPIFMNTAWFEGMTTQEGDGHYRKVYTISELLSSRELEDEGRAMSHCVGSYAGSCASGRTSIWVLKVADAYDRETRLLTLEVWNASRQIVQARQKFNTEASPKELSIVRRWASAGGPSLSKLLAR